MLKAQNVMSNVSIQLVTLAFGHVPRFSVVPDLQGSSLHAHAEIRVEVKSAPSFQPSVVARALVISLSHN